MLGQSSGLGRQVLLLSLLCLLVIALTSCARSSRPLGPQVQESDIAAELQPFLDAPHTATLLVRFDADAFNALAEDVDISGAIVHISPSVPFARDRYDQVARNDLTKEDDSMRSLRSKYPEIFRRQDCGRDNACRFPRLPTGTWHVIGYYLIADQGFLSATVQCWAFAPTVELTDGEELVLEFRPGEQTAYRIGSNCYDE
ncbi:MAG: hypothetical protein AAFY02_16410 [Pseudomonadota bacterium]